MPCSPQKLLMNLHSVLHNVKIAAVPIVRQLIYNHQRKHVSKVWNHFQHVSWNLRRFYIHADNQGDIKSCTTKNPKSQKYIPLNPMFRENIYLNLEYFWETVLPVLYYLMSPLRFEATQFSKVPIEFRTLHRAQPGFTFPSSDWNIDKLSYSLKLLKSC